MREWLALAPGSDSYNSYAHARQAAFARLTLPEDTPQSRHVAILDGPRIAGGFSLSQARSLSSDLDIRRYWKLLAPLTGIRISRLWIDRTGPRDLIQDLFRVLHVSMDDRAYYYGILSLPLSFANQNSRLFQPHTGHLEPALPLEHCNWAPDNEPASEGKRLLKIYLGMGAQTLGPPSGAQSDNSVRVALGIEGAPAKAAWQKARGPNA
jgi:hypothetical protein